MTKEQYIKVIKSVIESPRNNLQKITMLQQGFELYVAENEEAHWIRHPLAEESEGRLIPNYECSKCHAWKRENSDYCPECGCKMTEVT